MRLAAHECASAVTDVSSPDCACTAFRLCSSSDSIIAVRREREDYEAGWLSSHSSEVRAQVRPRKPVAKERKRLSESRKHFLFLLFSLCRNDKRLFFFRFALFIT